MKATSEKGFSLIELLVVAGMVGIVMGAVYSIYSSHQRSAYVQEDVVEVQQNLRIAMETMTRDIRNSGIFIPPQDAVGTANNVENSAIGSAAGDSISLNTASGNEKYAMITVGQVGISTAFTVDSAESVDAFFAGEYVRIMRAFDKNQPTGGNGTVFQIETVDRGSIGPPVVAPTIKVLFVSGAPADATQFRKTDMIVGMRTLAAPYPATIRYFLTGGLATCPGGQTCLVRRTDEGIVGVEDTQVVATNITGMQISYIQDNGAEVTAPVDLRAVKSVRLTITGATRDTVRLSDDVARTRAVSSVISLRNR